MITPYEGNHKPREGRRALFPAGFTAEAPRSPWLDAKVTSSPKQGGELALDILRGLAKTSTPENTTCFGAIASRLCRIFECFFCFCFGWITQPELLSLDNWFESEGFST